MFSTAFTACVIMSMQVFDQYVKTRAEEERKEKKNKLMQAKDEFRRMMEDAKLTPRLMQSPIKKKTAECFLIFDVCNSPFSLFHPGLRLVNLL